METSTWVIVSIVTLVLFITLSYFFFRFIFSMKRQLWNQKQQINLLIMIAEQLGVPHSKIELIEERNKETTDAYLS